jgi:hypothetical protein
MKYNDLKLNMSKLGRSHMNDLNEIYNICQNVLSVWDL